MSLVAAASAYRDNPVSEELKQVLLQEVVYALHSDMARLAARFLSLSYRSEFDDVTQAVWIRLFLKVVRLTISGRLDLTRSESEVRAYLCRIMQHDMLDIMREHSSERPLIASDEMIDTIADAAENHALTPEQALRDDTDEVLNALGRLSVEDQTIIKLRLFKGLSHFNVAKHFSISVDASRVRYHRALARLRDQLAK